jgi:dTDP-4-dehydrorhamnose reductase
MQNFSILCTGSSGLVASNFKKLCLKKSISFYGLDLHGENKNIDITKKEELLATVKTHCNTSLQKNLRPILFHFAAITITGKNLTSEQIELSKKINIEGTANILQVCQKLNILLVHISTDFVFAGAKKNNPYLPNDEICPDKTVYSQTKAEAEKIVLAVKDKQQVVIIRLAFPYGNFSHAKMGLLRKMLDWMDKNEEVNLYSDQKACPTSISYFSQCCLKTAQLISEQKIKSGQILHCVGKPTTPYEFGKLAKEIFNKNAQLNKSSIGDGVKNLVLDTKETEEILGIIISTHNQAMKSLENEIV